MVAVSSGGGGSAAGQQRRPSGSSGRWWPGTATGERIALKGPRHRAVLARLIVARGRVVPVATLVDDLWADPPPGAVGAVRTFVAALRRALEPDRPPRAPARLLVTEGPGYALRAEPEAVDAWRFERALERRARRRRRGRARRLDEALGWWRGPAYADFADAPWARAERSRLAELRLHAVERRAEARLALGRAAEAVPDLDAHVAEHPWREDAWRLLALALYRTGRQGDALAVLRRARTLLVEQLGVDPGPALRRLETDILHQADSTSPRRNRRRGLGASGRRLRPHGGRRGAGRGWSRPSACCATSRSPAAGLEAARGHRLAAVTAAEELGDAELTARVIGAYDVPAIWTRSDDPEQAARDRRGGRAHAGRARPRRARRGPRAAAGHDRRSSPAARATRAPARPRARRRDRPPARRSRAAGVRPQRRLHAELPPRGPRAGAGRDRRRSWSRCPPGTAWPPSRSSGTSSACRPAARWPTSPPPTARRGGRRARGAARATRWSASSPASTPHSREGTEAAYTDAAARLDGAGMPGLEEGLLALALLCVRLREGEKLRDDDFGPHEPWARPLVHASQGSKREARAALHRLGAPPHGLLYELLWCLTAHAARTVSDGRTLERARTALTPPRTRSRRGVASSHWPSGEVPLTARDRDRAARARHVRAAVAREHDDAVVHRPAAPRHGAEPVAGAPARERRDPRALDVPPLARA